VEYDNAYQMLSDYLQEDNIWET